MKQVCSIAITAIVLLLNSCNTGDIHDIKVGMTADEVSKKMGKPDQKEMLPLDNEWWKYGNNQMIGMNSDTVTIVVEDIKKYRETNSESADPGMQAADEARKNLSAPTDNRQYIDTAAVDNTFGPR